MKSYKIFRNLSLLLLAGALSGCTRNHEFQPVDMWNNTRLKPYEELKSAHGTTALPMPAGIIARGQLRENDALYRGKTGDKLVTAFPIAITPEVLKRGQERYTVFCAPCHGGLGDGKGIIVQRGFSIPPDYTIPRLVDAPVGHFYDVITNGYGAMYSYAARVPVNDRWAISAYIRVLQKTRAKGRKPGGPTMPGGGVYTPGMKPFEPDTGEHGGAEHGGSEHKSGEHENAPGVAPGSSIPKTDHASGGAAEGATHEKAIGGDSSDKASNDQGASPH